MKHHPRIKDLDFVFTYAQSTDKRTTNLLFSSLTGRTEIFQERAIRQIADDPLYQEIMGKNSILMPHETTPFPVLLATTEFQEQAAARMELASAGEAVIVCREGHPPESINLRESYYSCQLPQKLILGCLDCVKNTGVAKGCAVRQAAVQAINVDFQGLDPEDLGNMLKSRISAIGDFKYISPVLTTHKNFVKTIRSINEHDFSFVGERANIRESIIAARTRLSAVKKNICAHCCVQERCHSEYDVGGYLRNRIRNCNGKYPDTEEEIIRRIIAEFPPTMSFEQMSVLFANSGELHKRFNRRISYATFASADKYRSGGTPVFAIVSRRGTGKDYICKDYDEAISIIKEHNGHLYDPVHKVTEKTYALLVEAIGHRFSPRSRTRWHITQYPRLYISTTWKGGIEVHYTFNSHGRQELPWSLEANDFGVFVQHYYDLDSIGRMPFTDEDLKPKRDRK